MLSPRTGEILKFVVRQYITTAQPVPSQVLAGSTEFNVSSATVRNEMALLEREGYIARPHTSAGCVPTDKGYRFYVESLGDVKLPIEEQRLISHMFHQVERELDEWLSLAATLIARMVQNVSVVTLPKPGACRFRHLELVNLHDATILLILALSDGRVRQQLVSFEQAISQPELTAMTLKLSSLYAGLTSSQIAGHEAQLTETEKQVTEYLTGILEAEDADRYEEQSLDGLHFMLNQPEFAHNQRLLSLMELIEQRRLIKSILPQGTGGSRIQVVIGKENRTAAIQDYSVVISRYGMPAEAVGTIGVIGPTRMPYARAIATVDYVSSVLNGLAARLYGKKPPPEQDSDPS